jgi:hypothetical protein
MRDSLRGPADAGRLADKESLAWIRSAAIVSASMASSNPMKYIATRHILITLFAVSALFASPPSSALAQTTAIRFGRLVDGQGRVIRDAVVIVDGERITRIGSGDAAGPSGISCITLPTQKQYFLIA